jgi:transcription elongation factor
MELGIGTPVRIIRAPYFGLLGVVEDLPAEPELIPTGAKVRVVRIRLQTGELVTVPRANVEIISR